MLWGGAPGEWEDEHPADAAAASPWGDEVFLAGWHDHAALPGALASADVLAGPSATERFGLVYVEAMAMRRAADRHRRRGAAHLHRRRPGVPGARRAGSCRAATTRRWRRPWPTPRPTRPSAPCAARNGRRVAARRFGWGDIARRVVGIYAAAAVPVG